MPNWTGGIITARGRELQAKVEAGETLIITKMKLGSGTPQAYEMDTLTDLKQPLMEFGISSKTVENNICEVTGVVVSSEIETPFYAREWGLFAQDPDEGEILYMYTTDPNPDFIPAKTAALQISATYALNIVVLNVDNIIVNIDPNGLVTTAILKNELKKYLPLSGGDMTGDITANNVYANNNVLVFNSVAEMKASNKVKVGYTVKTLGYYEQNDGGGADYVIVDDIGEDEIDEASLITLQKELYAKLLVQDYVNVKQFGAKGDGETDDTEAIQKSFDLASKYGTKLIFPKAVYSVSKVIYNATVETGNPANIEFNFATLKAKTENDFMFEINSENFDGTNKQFRGGRINNLKVDCNNLSSLGVLVTKATNYTIDTLNIINVKDTGYKHVSGSGVTLQNAYASGYSPDVYTKGFLVHGDSVYRNIGTEDITVSVEEVSQGSRIDIINLHSYYSKIPSTPEIFKKSCCIKAYKNSNILASHVIADGINSLFYLADSNISVIGSNLDIHNAISPSEYPTYADGTTTQYLFKYDENANLDNTDKQNVSNLVYYCFTGVTDTQKLSNIGENFKGTVIGLVLKLDNVNLQMSIPYSCNTGVIPYNAVILNTDFTNTDEVELTTSNTSENSQYINVSKSVGVKFKNMFNNSVVNDKFNYYRKLMQLIAGSETTYAHINTEFDVKTLDDLLSNSVYFFSTFYSDSNSHMSLSIYLKNADGANSTMISSGSTYYIQGNTAKTWVFPITLDKGAIFAWLQSHSDKEIKVKFEFNFEVPMNSNVYIKNFGFYTANSPYYAVPNI